MSKLSALSAALLCASAAAPAVAQTAAPAWHYTASIYSYLPTITTTTAFTAGSGGETIDVSAGDILNKLKMTFSGTLEAHNGTWGVFTDLMYTDVGDSKRNTRSFSIGKAGIPAATTADLQWDYKSTLWTIAGEYRVGSDPSMPVDVFGGARLFDQRQRLAWGITGSLGTLPATSRSGSSEVNDSVWDAIVGVKGRYFFSGDRRWSMPFYLDVGAGGSESTVQAAVGVGYAFSWGELTGAWRYIRYSPKSGSSVDSMEFSGPQVGAVFRW